MMYKDLENKEQNQELDNTELEDKELVEKDKLNNINKDFE